MVRASRARNIFPALLSIFRPLSPDILPPMWEGKLFSYILSSPSRVGKHGDDGTSPPPQGIRGCPPGVQARGPCVLGCSVGASAAPCSADFDPPGRTAPAGRGGRQPRALCGLPAGSGVVSDHRRWGGGEAAIRAAPLRIVGDSEAGWVRALGEPPAWGEPASRRGGSRPAPSRAQEGGREHPRRGRRPPHRPAVERARKLLSATRWTNFSGVLGLRFFLTPRPAQPREEGGGKRCPPEGGTDAYERHGPPIRPSSPHPLPVRGLLGNCDLNGC